MPKTVLDRLGEWDEARPAKLLGRGGARYRPWNVGASWRRSRRAPIADWRQTEEPCLKIDVIAGIDQEWSPKPSIEPAALRIPCVVVEIGVGADAVCSRVTGGYELPRVTFPAAVLRAKQLGVGARFTWLVRDPEHVRPSDVEVAAPTTEELTAAEKAEEERLFKQLERRLAAGEGEWPVASGDGK